MISFGCLEKSVLDRGVQLLTVFGSVEVQATKTVTSINNIQLRLIVISPLIILEKAVGGVLKCRKNC